MTPLRALARLGASDRPTLIAVVYLLAVQAAFLATLIHNFLVHPSGEELAGAAPRLLGAVLTGLILTSVAWQVAKVARRMKAQAAQEHPSTRNPQYLRAQELLHSLLARVPIDGEVALCYDRVNAEACHVTELADSNYRIVFGLQKACAAHQAPRLAESFLAHEVSHVERGGTRLETWARAALHIYLRTCAAVIASTLLLVGYLQPEVSDKGVSIAGIFPTWNWELLSRFAAPILIQALISAMVVGFSYFILIRRELLHDIRALQIVGHSALLTDFFALRCRQVRSQPLFQRTAEIVTEILRLHPSACHRARVLASRDWITLDTVVYPLIAGVLITTPLLLLGPVFRAINVGQTADNVLATVIGAALIHCVTRADVGRFAALRLTGRQWIRPWLRYAAVMAASASLTGLILGLWYEGAKGEWPSIVNVLVGQFERFAKFATFLLLLLWVSTYLVAAQRLAEREDLQSPGARNSLREGALFLLTLGAFTAQSLSAAPLRNWVFVMTASFALITLFLPTLVRSCGNCGARQFQRILRLAPACARCGHSSEVAPNFTAVTSADLK